MDKDKIRNTNHEEIPQIGLLVSINSLKNIERGEYLKRKYGVFYGIADK
jgi:hypothetical protein